LEKWHTTINKRSEVYAISMNYLFPGNPKYYVIVPLSSRISNARLLPQEICRVHLPLATCHLGDFDG
jgi:hypothetical protein